MYQTLDPQTKADLWVLPARGGGKPWPFLKAGVNERSGAFSPTAGSWPIGRMNRDEARSTCALGSPGRATRIVYGGTDNGRQYDVARDGRFLINTLLTDRTLSPITLVQNGNPEVKK